DDVFINSPQRDAQSMEVESKMRVLTSRNVLARVIADLRLTEDSEFVGLGAMDVIKALIGLGPDRSDGTSEETSREIAAMRALSERVDARREDRSFVVALEVWSEEPA